MATANSLDVIRHIAKPSTRSHSEASDLLSFLASAERLKTELRHSWLSNGRQESVAEHIWQLSLMVMLVADKLEHRVDVAKALKLAIVHDLAEIETGDVAAIHQSDNKTAKYAEEQRAMGRIAQRIGGLTGREIHDLWREYEERTTPEAKLVKALDALEAQIQHNLADISTWAPAEYSLVYTKMDRHCGHDRYLAELCQAVKGGAELKMSKAGIDVEKAKAGAYDDAEVVGGWWPRIAGFMRNVNAAWRRTVVGWRRASLG